MTKFNLWQHRMGFSPVERVRSAQAERRCDYGTRIMVSILKAWLRDNKILPLHALDIMRHRGVSQASRMRIIDNPGFRDNTEKTTLEMIEEHNNGHRL